MTGTSPAGPNGTDNQPDASPQVGDPLRGHLLRGVLMGFADSVPGISGGTVALVLGIYGRLVLAISHFDRQLVRLLISRQWRQAAQHIDLRFLCGLFIGIVVGLLTMTSLAHQLLEQDDTRPFTLALFLGMMLSCSWYVALPLRPKNTGQLWIRLAAAAPAALLAWIIASPAETALSPSLWYLFVCGMVGICAMILPGISGAMILVIMGVYSHLTGIPGQLYSGEQVVQQLAEVVVFAAGCLTGLMIFSRLLRYLLANYHSITMAILCGAMVGSLRALWPFKQPLGQLSLPTILGVLLTTATGVIIVLASSRLAAAHKKTPPGDPSG